jgi:hypothetical protein
LAHGPAKGNGTPGHSDVVISPPAPGTQGLPVTPCVPLVQFCASPDLPRPCSCPDPYLNPSRPRRLAGGHSRHSVGHAAEDRSRPASGVRFDSALEQRTVVLTARRGCRLTIGWCALGTGRTPETFVRRERSVSAQPGPRKPAWVWLGATGLPAPSRLRRRRLTHGPSHA